MLARISLRASGRTISGTRILPMPMPMPCGTSLVQASGQWYLVAYRDQQRRCAGESLIKPVAPLATPDRRAGLGSNRPTV
jgi:hypothetical protein